MFQTIVPQDLKSLGAIVVIMTVVWFICGDEL